MKWFIQAEYETLLCCVGSERILKACKCAYIQWSKSILFKIFVPKSCVIIKIIINNNTNIMQHFINLNSAAATLFGT